MRGSSFAQGRPAVAERHVDEALELARSAGYPQVLGAAFGVRALVAVYIGELDWARALLAESGERTRSVGDRWHTLHNRVTLGFLEASVGRYAETLVAVGSLAEELDDLGIGEPGIFPFEGDAIEAAVALGQADDAERLIQRLEIASRARGRWPWPPEGADFCSPRAPISTPRPTGSRRRSATMTICPTRSNERGRCSPTEPC